MRRVEVLAVLAVGVVVLVAVAVGLVLNRRPAYPVFEVDGNLTIQPPADYVRTGQTCTGTNGFEDIRGGTPVTVYDPTGRAIASGVLDPGAMVGGCEFQFTVKSVPVGLVFYGIEVSHRGVTRYPEADLKTAVELSLS